MALLLNVFNRSLFRCHQFLLNFINELITENISALSKENLSDYTKYAQLQRIARILKLSLIVESFVCLLCCFTSQVNSSGHGGTVSSPNHTFSWAGLKKRLTS